VRERGMQEGTRNNLTTGEKRKESNFNLFEEFGQEGGEGLCFRLKRAGARVTLRRHKGTYGEAGREEGSWFPRAGQDEKSGEAEVQFATLPTRRKSFRGQSKNPASV